MRFVVRVPKKQVRVIAAAALVAGLGAGAGVAAQSPTMGLQGALASRLAPAPVAPHDAVGISATGEQHPETALATGTLGRPALETHGPAQQGQQGQQGQGQQGQAGQPPAQGQPGQLNAPLLTPEEREALELVEQMIRDQEGIIMGTAFDYNPRGRRDPFRSLLAAAASASVPTVRPFGLPGFLIGEVEVKATAEAQGRWHAMLMGPDQRAYFVEVGSQLFDGHVVEIRLDEVVFEQEVTDPMGARRTRQVTKRLRTTNSGGGQTSQ